MTNDHDVTIDNRRASTRVPMSGVPVTLEYEGASLEGKGADFNDDCLSVAVADPPPIGAEVTVRCVDDSEKEVVFRATVLRHNGVARDGLQSIVLQEVSD